MTNCLVLTAVLAACAGTRDVARPTTPAGYHAYSLHDITLTRLGGENVEVTGKLMLREGSDDCGGLIYAYLMDGDATLTMSISRSRYAEISALPAFADVRVRGYLGDAMAQGCSIGFEDSTVPTLWIDTIAPRDTVAP